MIRSDEVASSAPTKRRRARTARWRGMTVGVASLTAMLGTALVPGLGLAPAGATGPTVTTIAGHSDSTTPSLGVPAAAGSAKISPTYVAYNPSNGDTAVASTQAGSVYVYLIAGASEPNEYNIQTAPNPSPAFGSLTSGDAYLVAGTGTAGLIAQPGNNQFGNSTTAVATANPITPTSVAFDRNGNLLIAGADGSTSAIQVVAKTTGTFYGVSMTAGDLYTIADVGVSGAPSSAINMGAVAAPANGMSVDSSGNIVVGNGIGVDFVNEQASGTLSLYGKSIAAQSSVIIAGSLRGGTDCSAGAASASASSLYFQSPAPYVDSSDNVYFSDNESGGSSGGGCDWVLPAQSGTLDGLSVTAGNAYKLAGNGGTTATSSGTAGVDANVAGTSQMTLDGAGNVDLAVSGAASGTSPALQVLAESTGTFYGVSMTAGDIYTVAGGPSNTLATLSGPTSLLNAGGGNLYFTDGAASSANLDEFSGAPTTGVPVVSSVSPNTGPAAGSTSVTVTGTNLAGATAVDFGTANPGTITADSATSITVTSPAGTGTVNVTVTTPVGTSVTSSADQFTYASNPGGTVVVSKSTGLIGNYPDDVSGTGWTHDTSVTIHECASTTYSASTCDAANPASMNIGTGRTAGDFKDAVIHVAVGTIDTNNDTCGVAGAGPCYIVVVGNTTTDTTSSGVLSFTLPSFTLKKTTGVLGNYVDNVKAAGFPAGDTIVAQECDASVSVPSTVPGHCDSSTDISGTAGATGKVAFSPTTGVKLLVGDAYSDTASGTCQLGGSCAIGLTDSDNSAIGVSTAVTFAAPVSATIHESAGVLGNYVDTVKVADFPIGDTVVAEECDPALVIPTTISSNCDASTQITGTVGGKGAAVFSPTGVKLLEGSAYSDSGNGACPIGGSCEVLVSDSDNLSIGTDVSFSFAAPAATAKETANVAANYIDKVTATKFAVGDTVTAQECDHTVTSGTLATNCDPATQISGTVNAKGEVPFSAAGVKILVGNAYSESGSGSCPAGGTCDIVVNDAANGSYVAIPVGLAS